jgi:thioredoxin 1
VGTAHSIEIQIYLGGCGFNRQHNIYLAQHLSYTEVKNIQMGTATFIQDETEFDSLLVTEALLVVDCTATWCGPCKLVAPLIDKLADNYGDRAKILKLDIDNNKPIAKRFGLRSIPAVMFFKQGELVDTLVGVKPYEEFSGAVEKYL